MVKPNRLTYALSLLVAAAVALMPAPGLAQGTGEFLCSAGSRNGQPCEAFSDCPGGVCIIAQGVCSDGNICVCPGGGECVDEPVCTADARFGTCDGGVADGVCCDTDFNCGAGDSCAATQRLCLSGSRQGFPCTSNAQCSGATCAANGYFCDGGENEAYGCVSDADCPGSFCNTSFVSQPTSTPVTPGTPPPATPTQGGGGTPLPTNTQRPFPTVPTGVVPPTPTSPPQNTATIAPPTATSTPVVGTLVNTVGDAVAGANKITVAIDPTSFPVEGVVDVGDGTMINFTRRRSSTILDLKAADGLPFGLGSGSVVRVVEYTPTPGPVIIIDEGIDEGDSCAIAAAPARRNGAALWLLGIGLALAALRRRR